MTIDPKTLVYEDVRDLNRSQMYKDLLQGDAGDQVQALLSISQQDDWHFAQDVCFKYARSLYPDIRRISITGLGHIARIHGAINMGSVWELVGDLRHTGRDDGAIEDMLGDIIIFVARRGRRAV